VLQDRLDLRGVVGNGIQPSVLREAGIEEADMLIACAPQDETNLVACKVAHDLFNVPTTIARVRSPEFENGSELLGKQGFAVDQVICPEQSVTAYMRKLIEYPEALQVLEFAHGLVSLMAVRAVAGRAAGAAQPGRDPAAGAGHGDAHRGHLPPGPGADRPGR
jgi:trk system potassium uptake protein TrkA